MFYQKILENYNNSYHSVIKMTPNEVTESNRRQVLKNIEEKATRKIRPKINVGDRVRVQLKRKAHDKGYKPKYSKQVYTVEKIEGKYYMIHGLDRKYLRAFIEKVGESQENPNKPDLEG